MPCIVDDDAVSSRGGLRRRDFLQVLQGLGAAALAPLAPLARADAQDAERLGSFSRMFREVAFAPPTPQLSAALMEIGRPGGMMDAADPLHVGPVLLITQPQLSPSNRDNASMSAGVTFMGQFMDHDMTFDTRSRLGQPTSPQRATNARTPAFDLDSVYAGGPVASPQLYRTEDRAKLRLESGGLFEDLPRMNPARPPEAAHSLSEGPAAGRREPVLDNTALIGDPRNDEHLILAGLHAAFIAFHNRAVDHLRSRQRLAVDLAFDEARRLTTWHYQWLIVNEFLPQFIGSTTLADIVQRGRRFYTVRAGDDVTIPVEFQAAAYRFGHSLVRPSYRANLAGDNGQPFFAFIFDPTQIGLPDPADLSGGCRAPRRFVGWQTFFDFRDGNVRPNKRIDTKLSTPLFELPRRAIPALGGPTSLAQRNLLRHVTWSLPSGQTLARAMSLPALSRADLADLQAFDLRLDASTPLWFYLLREADLIADGRHLGPVGARIVGEVILGLLQSDRDSYLFAEPAWRPTLPTLTGNAADFRMVDFLRFAGVDPGSRGQ